jgi:hypothetical protein
MTRRLTLAMLAACAALAPGASAAPLTIGIAEQKPLMFSDPLFLSLGVTHARYSAGWDVLTSEWQTAQLTAWLDAARLAGVQPLITFGHSRTEGQRRVLPTPERFKFEFRRFRERFPWVTDFATWNEANHCGEPTCHRASLVAGYWRKLRQECPTCTILAAELLDMPNMVRWATDFTAAAGEEPAVWGLHNYVDANRRRLTSTRALLDATAGQLWFTETGGIVARRNRSKTAGFEESPAGAAGALRWLFDDLVPLSDRITRVYVYHWSSSTPDDTWDSALIGPDGQIRPGFRVVRNRIVLHRRR